MKNFHDILNRLESKHRKEEEKYDALRSLTFELRSIQEKAKNAEKNLSDYLESYG